MDVPLLQAWFNGVYTTKVSSHGRSIDQTVERPTGGGRFQKG